MPIRHVPPFPRHVAFVADPVFIGVLLLRRVRGRCERAKIHPVQISVPVPVGVPLEVVRIAGGVQAGTVPVPESFSPDSRGENHLL